MTEKYDYTGLNQIRRHVYVKVNNKTICYLVMDTYIRFFNKETNKFLWKALATVHYEDHQHKPDEDWINVL